MDTCQTVSKTPAEDHPKSVIENQLELIPLLGHGCDTFTNARSVWHPPGARGIFGGVAIAQSLIAAQSTVSATFNVHSMHGYFIAAGSASTPIRYNVERLRDGRSFVTRAVKAMQGDNTIFTATFSFVRAGSQEKNPVRHCEPMPADVPVPHEVLGDITGTRDDDTWPYINKRVGIINGASVNHHEKRAHQWFRACGRISSSGGRQAHLAAVAFLSDSYFIGAIPSFHKISRFATPPITEFSAAGYEFSSIPPGYSENVKPERKALGVSEEGIEEIGMMISLDHTIYFHNAEAFRADEWMLTEVRSNWADSGRGLVSQKIWTTDGILVATCIQEGIVRLSKHTDRRSGNSKTKL